VFPVGAHRAAPRASRNRRGPFRPAPGARRRGSRPARLPRGKPSPPRPGQPGSQRETATAAGMPVERRAAPGPCLGRCPAGQRLAAPRLW